MKQISTNSYSKIKKDAMIGASHSNNPKKKDKKRTTGTRVYSSGGCSGCRRQ